jgi:beta-glucosidase
MTFPHDFVWGAATSNYQIEGAAWEDGRGECIWTRFSHTPGKVTNGDTGDVACDHYHRYAEDIALLRTLGLGAYRYSVSWPRILPQGSGALNAAGLDFYDRLTDTVLSAGLRPFVTLYHWDLPQALQDQGGWVNPASVGWFAAYADAITQRLGDRVKDWTTLNEPWCSAFLGYWVGEHAPGIRDIRQGFHAAHHLLLAHAAAVPDIRRNAPGARVGITLNPAPQFPASDAPENVAIARFVDGTRNRWWLDPIYRGAYPADIAGDARIAPALEGLDVGRMGEAAVPLDFLGINYYTHNTLRHDPSRPYDGAEVFPPDARFTAMGWEIDGRHLQTILERIHADYAPPAIYVTESGAAFPEPDHVEGEVLEDPDRVEFLRAYLRGAAAALAHGVPLKGYFVWSFLDNFEWAHGYAMRFGIVHIDFATQRRTLKRSAHDYGVVVRTGVV